MKNDLKDYPLEDIVNGLLGECYPYGSETYDDDRYSNLLTKISIVDKLIDEIKEAGKLYNRREYSILRISNKANEYLTDLRDWLNDIEYLPEREIEENE